MFQSQAEVVIVSMLGMLGVVTLDSSTTLLPIGAVAGVIWASVKVVRQLTTFEVSVKAELKELHGKLEDLDTYIKTLPCAEKERLAKLCKDMKELAK